MNQTYKAINKLSKAVYDRWGANVTFDFASFAKETRDFSPSVSPGRSARGCARHC